MVTVPGGAGNYVEALLLYQEPSAATDLNFNGNITTNIHIDRNPGPGITIRATVYRL
ncbi:MAG: hypothetical protein MZV70_59370 [Desulfobacterales bacterium]|nr:hypothetical protein [Desulfobacterales bacterium]